MKMQLVSATTPLIVTRALVTGMSNVVCATAAQLFATLSEERLDHTEETLMRLRIRTDVELIGALLSDLSDVHDMRTSHRVSLEHLHTALHEVNRSLGALDASLRGRDRAWLYSSPRTPDPKLIRAIEVSKQGLDHAFQRLIEVTRVVAVLRPGWYD